MNKKNTKNLKKEKIKEKKENKKKIFNNKILKTTFIVCGLIVIVELLLMLIMYIKNENKIKYIDFSNNMHLVDNEYYLLAGSSNFKYSKYNKKKVYRYKNSEVKSGYENIIAEQAKLVKYDLDLNIIWEKTFESDYDSTFYDAIKVSDGIIAVGSYVYEYEQISLRTRDGLMVKYDDDGNYKWSINYQVLGDTEFYKVIDVGDGLIVVGQSIYENNEIGNHDTGGGIIVKYDYDGKLIWNNNYGGNKSGSFNDIVKVNDGYVVCGKDGANYGLIAKFSLNGDRVWQYSTYNLCQTDNDGFNSMVLYDNKLYIASSINTSDEKDDDGNPIYSFDACIYVYNLKGKFENRYIFGGTGKDQFISVIVNEKEVIGVGYTNSLELADDIAYETGLIARFDKTTKEVETEIYGGMNHDMLTTIIENEKHNYLISGYSNSFGNKKDFNVIFKTIEQ